MISPAISALADAALLLPASCLVLLYLAALRQGRLILAFAASLGAAAIATILLKLLFHACGHAITEVRVMSPSGHVAFGTAFYGALAIMLASGRARALRAAGLAATLLLLVAIGISRVRVGAHSTAEVLIGYLVGGAALVLFALLHRWAGRPGLPWIPVAAGFAGAVLLLWGSHFSLERSIAGIARDWAAALDVCAPPSEGPWRRFSSDRH
jgi:membrane-associated phospholipid phosphatase